jgi:hypothetical protein
MENLMSVDVVAPKSEDTPEKQAQFHQRLLSELNSSSAVEAAMTWVINGSSRFAVEQDDAAVDYPEAKVILSSESPVQLGAKLIDGRYFDHRDGLNGAKSAMVSQTFAKTMWPEGSALGRRIRVLDLSGQETEQRVVIGVLSDVLDGEGLMQADQQAYTVLYLPFAQMPNSYARYLVRHRGDESAARDAISWAVERLSSGNTKPYIERYKDQIGRQIFIASAATNMLIYSGVFSLLLALTGIYALSSNAVLQRTQEIGLRRAIGATDKSILRLFLRQGGRQLSVGFLFSAILCGLALFVRDHRFCNCTHFNAGMVSDIHRCSQNCPR